MLTRSIISFILILLISNSVNQTSAYHITSNYLNLDGKSVNMSKFEGKILLVEGFATWCPHCHKEYSELVKVWKEFNSSINMLSLSVADDDDLTSISQYLEKYPTSWDIGWDSNLEFKRNYNIPGYPSMLLFDSTGNFASCSVGERSASSLISDINSLINDSISYLDKNSNNGVCDGGSSVYTILPIILIGFTLSFFIAIYYFKKSK